jgi:phospholipid/cholesterol/gamma-HCH transport system substrate-binding protein
MASEQEARWSPKKIALVVVSVPVAVLGGAVFVLAGGPGLLRHRMTVTSYFDNAAGLKVGAEVNLEGVTIGSVKSITMVATPEWRRTPVQVTMELKSRFEPSLHEDSTATLTTVGVLADTVVDIDSSTANGPALEDGGELKSAEAPTREDMMNRGEETAEHLKLTVARMDALVDKIQTGKGSIGQFIHDPQINQEANALVDEAHRVAGKLDSNDNTAGRMLSDVRTGNGPWKAPLDKIASLTNAVGNGDDAAGKEIKDQAMRGNLNSVQTHANALAAEVNAGKGGVGMWANDPAFGKKMADTVAKTNALVAGVNAGEGSVGKLTAADGLASLSKLESESKALAAEIRKDPKKCLTIEVRLF